MESSVVRFYEGGHVLVTGATGFMGKVLIEKLLRSCTGIQQIYLLIRVKKGKEPAQRIKELFDDPVFAKMKAEVPDFGSKLTLVPGDCSVAGLGISQQDRDMLTSVLTHVFHGAATVNFDEKLGLAVGINVLGVREMMMFCQGCKKLKVIIHTSTAYAHSTRTKVEEKFYPPPMTVEGAIQLVQCLDASKIDHLTEEIIKPWPNTYTFTKAIGEEAVKKYGVGLPIGIFRPAIVISTADAPVKGWIDNIYGPTGVVYGTGKGVLRVLIANPEKEANMVPVDKSVNALICAAWDVAKRHQASTNNADIPESQRHPAELTSTKNADIPEPQRHPAELTSTKNADIPEPQRHPAELTSTKNADIPEPQRHLAELTSTKTAERPESHAAVPSTRTDEIPIYQYVMSKENKITWGEYTAFNFKTGELAPSNKTIWYYTCTLTTSWPVYKFLVFLYHILPALVIDTGLFLSGNKPLLMKAYEKIHKLSNVLSYFSTREWDFSDARIVDLWESLSEQDKHLFEFDMRALDWQQYVSDSVLGVRLYLFKENPATIPQAIKRMFYLKIAHYVLLGIVYSILCYSFYVIVAALLSAYPEFTMNFTSSRWASRRVSIT